MKGLITKYKERTAFIHKYLLKNKNSGSLNDAQRFAALQEELTTLRHVIEDLEKVTTPTENSIKTALLDLKCRDTGESITEGEIVAIHDWGISSVNNVLGYAKFTWDEQYRSFTMEADKHTNIILDTPDFCIIEDNYDAFRTSPRKLTKEELEKLK